MLKPSDRDGKIDKIIVEYIMKKKLMSAASIVMIIAVLVSLSACSNTVEQAKIALLLNDFQKACNDLDTDAMFDCLHPDIVSRIKPYISLFESLTDDSLRELLFSALIEAGGGIGDVNEDFFFTMSVNLDGIDITDETTAKVRITINYRNDGEDISRGAVIYCEKVDGKWYIKGFSPT